MEAYIVRASAPTQILTKGQSYLSEELSVVSRCVLWVEVKRAGL